MRLIIIRNPFNPHKDKEVVELTYVKGKTLAQYAQPHLMGIAEYTLSVNGKIIDVPEQFIPPMDADVVLVPHIAGGGSGGGKNIFRTIAMIALTMYTGGVASSGWAATMTGSTFGASMLALGMTLVGGMLINSLFPIDADMGIDMASSSTSTSYGFNDLSTYTSQGNSCPKTFGTMKTAGQLLAQHKMYDGSNQYLLMVLSGGYGELDSITDIEIDGNPISYYTSVTYETRLGTNTQPALTQVPSTYADQQLNYELRMASTYQVLVGYNTTYTRCDEGTPGAVLHKNGGWWSWAIPTQTPVYESRYSDDAWRTQRLEGNASQAAEVTFVFPNGLYHVKDDGNYEAASVTLQAQYRAVGEAGWREWLPSLTITENINSSFYRAYTIGGLSSGAQYEVRVRCLSKSAQDNSRYSTTVYWGQLTGIVYDGFQRPGKALLAIKALATDQLSGSTPNVTWKQTRSKVYVWNPDTKKYETQAATNPAWACYDILHDARPVQHPITGAWEMLVGGCKKERLDYYAFREWAAFCTSKGLTFNYIFDSAQDIWKALSVPESSGRGKVIMRGTSFSCTCDSIKKPSQLFSSRNIYMDTFKETFLSMDDRANYAEVTFINKEKNYEKDTVACYAEGYDEISTVTNPTSISLLGCNNRAEAWRDGRYILRLNQYLIRTVSFEVDVDAIACQVGDVVLVQHDLPEWGDSAHVVSAEYSSIVLSTPVTLLKGRSYSIIIRLSNDVLVTKEVVSPAVDTDARTLFFKTPFTKGSLLPKCGDLIVFGETTKEAKPFTVVTISRGQEMRRKLTLLEFNAAVYNEVQNPPVINYTSAKKASIASFSAAEDGYTTADGQRVNILNVDWAVFNPDRDTIKTEVEVSTGSNSFVPLTSTPDTHYAMVGVATGTTYQIRARLVSLEGIPITPWSYSDKISITGVKDSPPPAPTSLVAAQRGDKVVVSCVIPSIPDYREIELRMDGDSWATSKSLVSAVKFPIEIAGIVDGTHIFRARTIDNIGQYSSDETTYILNVSQIMIEKNIILERDDILPEFIGNLTLDNLIIMGDSTKSLMIPSALTYGDLATKSYAELPTLVYGEQRLDASLISPVIDTFKYGKTGITLDFNWILNDINAVYGSFLDRTYGDYPNDVYGNITAKGSGKISLSFSENAIDWTAWQPYLPGQYFFRFIKYKIDLDFEGPHTRVIVNRLKQYYDVPDVAIRQQLSIPASPTYYKFTDLGADLYEKPSSVYCQVVNGGGNVYCDVTDPDKEGITLTCYDRNGTIVSGTVILTVHGY